MFVAFPPHTHMSICKGLLPVVGTARTRLCLCRELALAKGNKKCQGNKVAGKSLAMEMSP